MTDRAWDDFTNMVEWKSYAYASDVRPLTHDEFVVEIPYSDCFAREFGDWIVHVSYSGNDGCWKWGAEKMRNIGRDEYPHRVNDEIGTTFLGCMEECFTALSREGIIYGEGSAA